MISDAHDGLPTGIELATQHVVIDRVFAVCRSLRERQHFRFSSGVGRGLKTARVAVNAALLPRRRSLPAAALTGAGPIFWLPSTVPAGRWRPARTGARTTAWR